MDIQLIGSIAIILGALIAVMWGIPHAVLRWKELFDRLRNEKESRKKRLSYGGKTILRVGVLLNGDLKYCHELYRGFRSEAERLFADTQYEVVFRESLGSPRTDEDDINDRALKEVLGAFGRLPPSCLVTIGTRVSEYAVSKVAESYSILFIGVTDPHRSGLLEPRPGPGVAGTTYGIRIDDRIDFLFSVFPNLRRVGFVYHSDISQDLSVKNQFLDCVKSRHGFPGDFPAIDLKDVGDMEAIRGRADVFVGWAYLNSQMDRFIASGLPVAGINAEECRNGAVASTGNDDFAVGRLAAESLLFEHYIKGKSLRDLPLIDVAKSLRPSRFFTVNLQAARDHGLTTLEMPVLAKKAVVYDGFGNIAAPGSY